MNPPCDSSRRCRLRRGRRRPLHRRHLRLAQRCPRQTGLPPLHHRHRHLQHPGGLSGGHGHHHQGEPGGRVAAVASVALTSGGGLGGASSGGIPKKKIFEGLKILKTFSTSVGIYISVLENWTVNSTVTPVRLLLEELCLFICVCVCVGVCVGSVSISHLPISALSLGFTHADCVFPARASRLPNEAKIDHSKTKPSSGRV